MTTKPGGLEDVVAATSAICDVNGTEGRLIYYGLDVRDLAAHATFEETIYLLWHGRLPKQDELASLEQEIAENRALPELVLRLMHDFPAQAVPMEVLRSTVSLLSMYDPDDKDNSRDANVRKAMRLMAQTSTVVAAYHAIREGRQPVAPRQDLSLAANFIYMLLAGEQSDTAIHALDVALILHADHELNASTFAGRVTAATLSDMYSSVVAAICALKGPLHGGANEAVFRMLSAVGSPERAREYVLEALAEKRKVPGFGHRVYRTDDPRAGVLKDLSLTLGKEKGETKWYEISVAIAEVVMEQKGLYPNVDFYSASVYHSVGIPTDLFTPVFAISRMAGWTAHILEQYANNRLIRPRADYTGPRNVPYTAINER